MQTLLQVFRHLIDNGATVIVIEHDLDVIRSADYVIDMGPGGGVEGGKVMVTGTPEEIANNKDSVTGKYIESIPPIFSRISDFGGIFMLSSNTALYAPDTIPRPYGETSVPGNRSISGPRPFR